MARIRRWLPLGAIKMDRLPFTRVLPLVDHLRHGGATIPPIHVQKTPEGFVIRDGRHRWMACKLLGYSHIEVTYGERRKEER